MPHTTVENSTLVVPAFRLCSTEAVVRSTLSSGTSASGLWRRAASTCEARLADGFTERRVLYESNRGRSKLERFSLGSRPVAQLAVVEILAGIAQEHRIHQHHISAVGPVHLHVRGRRVGVTAGARALARHGQVLRKSITHSHHHAAAVGCHAGHGWCIARAHVHGWHLGLLHVVPRDAVLGRGPRRAELQPGQAWSSRAYPSPTWWVGSLV